MSAFGHDIEFTLEAIWKVLLVSLVLGAGLPAIFALGVRSLAWGTAADGTGGAGGGGGSAAGKAVAGLLFLIVLYCVASAIVYIVASGQGDDISFTHIVPTIKTKG